MTMVRTKQDKDNANAFWGTMGLGMGVTGLIVALTRAKSPTEGIDLTLVHQALAGLLNYGEMTQQKLDAIAQKLQDLYDAFQSGEVNINLLSPHVEPEEPIQIFNENIRVTTPVGVPLATQMVDFRTGTRLLLKAESSLDQAVTLQVVGDIFSTTSTRQTAINGPLALPAGGSLTAGLDWGDWHPYVGIQITVPVAPTTGLLTIYSIRKNVD